MLVSVVARISVIRALTAPGGTVPVAARGDILCPPVPLPTGPIVVRPSTWPVADRNAAATAALLCEVPPSQADRSYRIADAPNPEPVAGQAPVAGPGTRRSETDWRRRVVPPAPPANRCPPGTMGQRPVAGGKRGVPYRTVVGRPLTTCQPGIVTASQPFLDAAPVCAPGFSSRFVPGATVPLPAAGRPAPAGRAHAGAPGRLTSVASIAAPLTSTPALVAGEDLSSRLITAISVQPGRFLARAAA